MKFISILPINNMDEMFNQYTIMLLAHLSKKYPEYAKRAAEYDGYKIMDNSIIELGEAFSMQDLINEAEKCKVQEIILPDAFQDGPGTVKLVKDSIEWLREHNLLGRFKLMAVCHGRDLEELNGTFITLNSIPEIDVIGVPKVLTTWVSSRIEVAEIMTLYTNKEIHMLGCWDSLKELKELSPNSKIRSMDTCMPALLSIYDMGTFDDRQNKKIDLETAEINSEKYRKIMKDVTDILK